MVEQQSEREPQSQDQTTPLEMLAQLLPPVRASGEVGPRVAKWNLSRGEAARLRKQDRRALWRRWWKESWLSGLLSGIGFIFVPLLPWAFAAAPAGELLTLVIGYEAFVFLPALLMAKMNWASVRSELLPSDEAALEDGSERGSATCGSFRTA